MKEKADFCNSCAKKMGFPKPDIDVFQLIKNVKPGYAQGVGICEGCGLNIVAHLNGRVAFQTITSGWQDYARWYITQENFRELAKFKKEELIDFWNTFDYPHTETSNLLEEWEELTGLSEFIMLAFINIMNEFSKKEDNPGESGEDFIQKIIDGEFIETYIPIDEITKNNG
jgi:hypothetical protein